MLIIHKIASWYLSKRLWRIEYFSNNPHEVQAEILKDLLDRAKKTAWGRQYGYEDLSSVEAYRNRVPISTYEEIYPWIERSIAGEEYLLWPGRVAWFAKSSGTTNDRSKYIPVTPESFEETHFRAGRDMLAVYLDQRPESRLFTGKALSVNGSYERQHSAGAKAGDLSAVLIENLPLFFQYVRTPSKKVALMSEWEEKIDAMAEEVSQADVTSIAGVPTWALLLIQKILTQRQVPDLLQVWPDIELFCHGGVNFEPYRTQFQALIPSEQMTYLNVYNASEGFFGFQDDFDRDDMLLLLDYGIYYEFIPLDQLTADTPLVRSLDQVETGQTYALVISTAGGLWRYMLGDTVTFTQTQPYRIRIAGRTKHFINAFGEELMVDNAEQAIVAACKATGAEVENYTAAPIYMYEGKRGGHEWLIEFVKKPVDTQHFMEVLDQQLKALNSDYAAKRSHDMAMGFPRLHLLPSGSFYHWMKKRGKLGGQNKVPRLCNDRRYVDDLLEML